MPGDAIARLTDPEHLTVVSIATNFGNNAYSMTVRGQLGPHGALHLELVMSQVRTINKARARRDASRPRRSR